MNAQKQLTEGMSLCLEVMNKQTNKKEGGCESGITVGSKSAQKQMICKVAVERREWN
jgi:hypothetical protein